MAVTTVSGSGTRAAGPMSRKVVISRGMAPADSTSCSTARSGRVLCQTNTRAFTTTSASVTTGKLCRGL